MKQTTKANASKTTNAKEFAKLLRNYEIASATNSKDLANALQELATAITYAVLKKLYLASGNKSVATLRNQITIAKHNANAIDYLNATNYESGYNDKGDYTTTPIDKQLDSALDKIIADTIGDGYDLVNDCIVAILDETAKAKERNNGNLVNCFMETPYTIRELNRKVWIKTAESVNGWQDKEVTPIQQVYRAVRRSIEQSRALQIASGVYTYLDEISKDPETDAETVIYRRFGKYADIGGAVTDYNGKETAYTTDTQSVADYDKIIAALNLTERQMTIINYRMKGYGYKAIATALGVRDSAIYIQVKRIQEKCVKLGITPETITA